MTYACFVNISETLLKSNRSTTYFGQATIDNEIGTVDEAALVAGKEKDRLSLFNGFTESAGWEMDFAAHTLVRIVSKPVLK